MLRPKYAIIRLNNWQMSTFYIIAHYFIRKYRKANPTIHICVKLAPNFSKFVKLTFVVNKVSDEKGVSVFMKKETVDTSLYIKHCYIQFRLKCVFHLLKKSFALRFHPFVDTLPSDTKGFKQCSFNARLKKLIALYLKHSCCHKVPVIFI